MPYTQTERVMKLITPLGEDALIPTAVRGREAISELFHFTVDAIWQDSNPLDFKKILGQNVTIELALGESADPRPINGIVISVSQGAWDREKDITLYTLEIAPQLWLLTRNTQIRIFQQQSTLDIIQKVIRNMGLASPTLKTQGSYAHREYTVQYYESDFAFISRLMEQDGIFYFFEHTASGHTMILADQRSVIKDANYGARVWFEEVMSGPREDMRIFEWNKAQTIRSGKYSLNDWNFEKPQLNLQANTDTIVQLPPSQALEIYEYSGKYRQPGEGEGVVKVRMQEEEAPGMVVGGKSWHWHFVPGYKFGLEGHFADKGKFTLTSVETDCSQPIAADSQEAKFQNRFTAIPEDVQFRPQRVTPIPHIRGVQTAIVTGPAGEEIYADKYGRVKVQFHWDREGQYNENSSCWIRVSTLWAGNKWGMIHLPRIGQEVIVDFIDGDVDRPIVTGSVYNAAQMPPWELPDSKNISGIRSRSTKDGDNDSLNEFRMDDTKGSEMFFLQAQKDMNVQVKNDSQTHIGKDFDLTVDNDSCTTIKGDVHESIDGTRKTEIKTDENLKVSGKAATQVDGSYSLKVSGDVAEKFSANHSEEAGQAIYLKAGMNVVIEAGVELSLKAGPSFIDLGASGVSISGPIVNINSGGAAASGSACSLVAAAAAKVAQLPITTKPTDVAALLSAGASAAGAASASAGAAGPSAPPPPRHNPSSDDNKDKKHWVEIVLVDDAGQPVTGESFEIKLPDGSVATGTTDEKGKGRVENIDPGSVEVSFPELDKDAWEPA